MVRQRTPHVAGEVVGRLSHEEPLEGCLGELRAAATEVGPQGVLGEDLLGQSCTRADALRKQRPLNLANGSHGWQYWASSVFATNHPKNSMLTDRRSHAGRDAGVVFSHAPTTAECTVPPHLFRVLMLERLQPPLQLTEATCNGCHERLDPLGRQGCIRAGRVNKRSSPTERMLARMSGGRRTREVQRVLSRYELGRPGHRGHRNCLASKELSWQSTSPPGVLSVLPVSPNLGPRRKTVQCLCMLAERRRPHNLIC